MMAGNIYWQRQTIGPDGLPADRGSLEYKMTPRGDQLVLNLDSGQSLVLFKGPQVTTAAFLREVGEQIGGAETSPNVIEFGKRFKTRDQFIRKILSYGYEPVIIAIDAGNWVDGTRPTGTFNHAITVDGVARELGTAMYHNTWGRRDGELTSIDRLYNALPK
jgi:hypothetical protein